MLVLTAVAACSATAAGGFTNIDVRSCRRLFGDDYLHGDVCRTSHKECDCVHAHNACACDACVRVLARIDREARSEATQVRLLCVMGVTTEIEHDPTITMQELDRQWQASSMPKMHEGAPNTVAGCFEMRGVVSAEIVTNVQRREQLWCPDISARLGITDKELR
jgi:hypothetical protein